MVIIIIIIIIIKSRILKHSYNLPIKYRTFAWHKIQQILTGFTNKQRPTIGMDKYPRRYMYIL